MSNEDNKRVKQDDEAEVLSPAAIARRHVLLKGLSRGSAVLAATVPLQTLASGSVFTNPGKNGAPVIRCGISGMTSGILSRDTIANVCSGYSPGYYKKRQNWPANTNPDAPCKNLFSRCELSMPKVGGGSEPASLIYVMNNYQNTDYFHWITAWLNGMGGAAGLNFPYTGQQVQSFYDGTSNPYYSPADALKFFKTYMEIHPGEKPATRG